MSDAVLYALKVTLGMDASEFLTGRSAIQRDLQSLRDGLASFGESWMRTGKRLTIGITAPLAAFGVASAKAASDAAELQSAFDQTFGSLAGEMDAWAEATGNAMGRSTQSMQELANTFGIFFNQAAPTRKEAAEMAKTFAVLAQDLGSFYNVTEDEALQKLRSGLAGESEPLRDFGVFLTEANVANKALEMGLAATSKELTEQDKILARYNLILEATTDAQGDVGRTSGGFANQMRAFWAAIEELRVVIGEKLLPMLAPVVQRLTAMVNGFNGLPAPIQNVIIAIGAFAAALGPMMLITGTLVATLLPLFAAKFGPIGLAISAFINPLGTAISLLAQFVARVAGMAILESIGGLLLRFLGPVGLLVTAGTLIYQNWGRIAPVFEEFWQKAQATLGPPLQELIATVTTIFNDLWNGPMGDGIRSAIELAKAFGAAASEIFGDVVIAVLKALLGAVITAFEQIGDAIRLVNALINGDFAGAWDAAVRIVRRILGPFAEVADAVIDSMRRLYQGVKTWLQDKLGAIFDWVNKKVGSVTGVFYDMYDKVVGNSYVPDMVDEIGQHFARLNGLMVDPAQKAARSTTDTMRDMAREVQAILAEAFPEDAARFELGEKLKAFDKAADSLNLSDNDRARGRLNLQRAKWTPQLSPELQALMTGAKDQIITIPEELRKAADRTQVQTVRIAETFQQMTDRALGALRRLTDGIRQGDFLSILEGVLGIFSTLGGAGVFGKTIQQNLQRTPGFANGGAMLLGGFGGIDTNVLSLNGSPIARVSRGETMEITPANDRSGGGASRVHVTVGIDQNTGNLTAFVDGRAAGVVSQAAPAIASGGATIAQGQMAQKARRRIR